MGHLEIPDDLDKDSVCGAGGVEAWLKRKREDRREDIAESEKSTSSGRICQQRVIGNSQRHKQR